MSKFLTDVATGTKSVGDAFKDLASTFIDAILQMEAKALASEAFKALTGKGGDGGGSGTGGGGGGLIGSAVGALASIFGGGRADGGEIDRRKFYVVGENGPELFAPGLSGAITPNHQLKSLFSTPQPVQPALARPDSEGVGAALSGGGGGGGGFTAHVDASGIDPKIIHEAVRRNVLDVIARNPAHVRNAIG